MITKLRVLTHLTPDKSEWGYLEFREGIPLVKLDSGENIISTTPALSYELEHQVVVGETGESEIQQLKKRVVIILNPIFTGRFPYAPSLTQAEEPYYPPSTLGWFGRARFGVDDFSYIVQRLVGNDLWLTILNENDVIQECHRIKEYEYPILKMKDDRYYIRESINKLLPEKPEKTRAEILSILDGPPPEWSDLLLLTSDVDVQGLNVGRNMSESLDTLVPQNIEPEAREEIKAFFAWLLTNQEFPEEDPLSVSHRARVTLSFNHLIFAHTICSLLKIEPPHYVKLLYEATKVNVEWARLVHDGIGGRGTWHLPSHLFTSSVWTYVLSKTDRSIEIIKELNRHNQVITKLPVSYTQAKKSRTAFIDRMIMASPEGGVRLTARVRLEAIGLKYMIYVGRAHMYPHRHMRDITVIGKGGKNPEHIQTMAIPGKAAEVVKRVRPRTIEIGWSSWRGNYNLYNSANRTWNISIARMVSSLKYMKTVSDLGREFGQWTNKSTYNINKLEAKALDVASGKLVLDYLENSKYLDYIGFSNSTLQETLSNLKNAGVVDLYYEPRMPYYRLLTPVIIFMQGLSKPICSAARGFLKYAPTAQVFIGKDETSSIVITRIPLTILSKLSTHFIETAHDYDVNARFIVPQRYTSYTHNLFQRLLLIDEDGKSSWDDNVSDFI